jgi:hypothetical protein
LNPRPPPCESLTGLAALASYHARRPARIRLFLPPIKNAPGAQLPETGGRLLVVSHCSSTVESEEKVPPYASWAQVGGYFDGDGSISIRRTSYGRPYTLLPALEFGDQSRRQIAMLKSFLQSRGIGTGAMAKHGGAWRVEIGTIEGVTRALTEMLPFLYKKRTEARATLDYLSDKISANDLQRILRAAVRRGDTERLGPFVDIPWTRSEGAKNAMEFSWRFAGRKPSLGAESQREVIRRYEAGETQRGIARSLKVSRSTGHRTVSKRKSSSSRRVRAAS